VLRIESLFDIRGTISAGTLAFQAEIGGDEARIHGRVSKDHLSRRKVGVRDSVGF